MHVFLAIDLGAGSGRVIAAETDLTDLRLEEVHRFPNPGTDLPGGSFWNIVELFREIREGIRLAVEKYGKRIVSIGIDTWGCDFGLLDKHGRLLGLPHQYRDARQVGMTDVFARAMSEREAYKHTGVTHNFYNTSLHLLAEQEIDSAALAGAESLLFIPDLLGYWLCNRKCVERTIASTSQLLDPGTGEWAWPVIDALGLPRRIFGELVDPGTIIGHLNKEFADSVGLVKIPIVAAPSHDTAAAVAGIPMEGEDRLWLSSGTWSIMGLETSEAIRSPEAFETRCCNALGASGTKLLLKNIAGLWLIQECRRHWQLEGEEISFAQLAMLAGEAESHTAFIDPDDKIFAVPGDMPSKIQDYCRRTGQIVPESRGRILRVATESLALKYRFVLERFREISGKPLTQLYAGGGGIQNQFLSQATADATGAKVIAGPVEATSCGNVIVQMIGTGHLPDLAAGRRLIRDSFDFETYQPTNTAAWDQAYQRFQRML